jgi:FMNH2-dependent dimethyl sulfone monooxygenase
VPNVSGGLVTSTIEQRTDWSFDCNRTLARRADRGHRATYAALGT